MRAICQKHSSTFGVASCPDCEVERLNAELETTKQCLFQMQEAAKEALRAQEPVAWLHEKRQESDVVTDAVKHVWGKTAVGSMALYSIPLYTTPQPAPSEAKDAARYRVLRSCRGQEHDYNFAVSDLDDGCLLWGNDLDAAIDQAMKEQP